MSSKTKILIVDDNINYCEGLKDILGEYGYGYVNILNDGAELVKQLTIATPDLILLDVMMPHLGAFSVMEQISKQPALKELSVIIITGQEELKGSFDLDANVQACFIKPVDTSALIKKIREIEEGDNPRKSTLENSVECGCKTIETLQAEVIGLKKIIRKSDARFYNVTGKNVDGIAIVGADAEIRYLNPRMQCMLGMNIGDTLDQKFIAILGDNVVADINIDTPSDAEVDVEVRITAIDWQERDAFHLACRDITEKKRQARIVKTLHNELTQKANVLAHANKELDSFSYTVSHDLKAPLRSIIAFSELLSEICQDHCDEEAEVYLHYIISGGRKMSWMIDSLLAFSRVGQVDSDMEEVCVREIIDDVLLMMHADIKESNSSVRLEGEFPSLFCYKSKVIQVFLNLIGNSLKYVPSGTSPDIKVGCQYEGGNHLFYIKDNGIGIEEKHFSRIFGIFSRLHTDEYTGAGIGLTSVKKIIALHDGEVYVESKFGEGSTFYFTLAGSPRGNVNAMEGELKLH